MVFEIAIPLLEQRVKLARGFVDRFIVRHNDRDFTASCQPA